MSETITKFQPDRTVYLRGFNTFAAAASIHSASSTGFTISGTFRDPADFAVAVLYDVDNYYEHPHIKYLPDFDLSGLTLSFDLNYSDGLQPIDSPKYNWIDWATLDCIRDDGSTAQVRLFDNAMLASGSFSAAQATCTLMTGDTGIQAFDRATLWYQNLAFDYTVPAGGKSVTFEFFAQGTGFTHSITINGTTFSHTESDPLGEGSDLQASALMEAINAPGAQPYVTAEAVPGITNAVKLTVITTPPAQDGIPFVVSATDGAYGTSTATLRYTSLPFVAKKLADEINRTDWVSANAPFALMATSTDATITVTAARYGKATVSGRSVTATTATRFSGITSGSTIWVGGFENTVASVDSPTDLTLGSDPDSSALGADVAWVAPRGGHDGNLVELLALWQTDSLHFDQATYPLTGGSSDVTWTCTLDFTALGIDSLRQCWLTFAPWLVTGSYEATDWAAQFWNWQVTGPETKRLLKVPGPGSIRLDQADRACTYAGTWAEEAGFYSKYFASVTPTVFSGAGAGTSIVLNGTPYAVASVDSATQLTLTTAAGPGSSGAGVAWSMASRLETGLANVSGTSVTATSWESNGSVTVSYTCAYEHELWLGTSLYSDRANLAVSVDGDAGTPVVCRLAVDSAIVTRRRARTGVAAGRHTVTITPTTTGYFYFNFLEAAVAGDVPAALAARGGVSPALDFDTDHSYKLPPARIMWMMDQLGYTGPMNEYLGVFWWNQRVQVGAMFSQAILTFAGTFSSGDEVFLTLNATALRKTVFPGDTPETIATHFAATINGAFVGVWAAAAAGVLTITGRSAEPAYTVTITHSTTSTGGTVTLTEAPVAGVVGTWVIDDSLSPPLNRAARDWHADLYALGAAREREIMTACSMELVNPPSGYAAQFPNGTPVMTATGFGSLSSTQCAIGGAAVLAYQKAAYRCIAGLQAAAGLTPCLQYGEFLWWYFSQNQQATVGYASYTSPISVGTAAAHGLVNGQQVTVSGVGGNPGANGVWRVTVTDATHFTLDGSAGNGTYTGGGSVTSQPMAFYDAETSAAAVAALGHSLYLFNGQNDDPAVNAGADATFLRNRLRDHVAALMSDIRSEYPAAICELLWPYDVNYPSPLADSLGGRLNYFVNLPVEWKTPETGGLDRIKVEALAFATGMRNLNLSREAIELFPGFGWPVDRLRYLVPVFGSACPWVRELALARGAGLKTNNLWAFDHVCLYNLQVPEGQLERRSFGKAA